MLPNELLLEPAWQRLAVVLMHFIWQGALVAAVYGVVVEWWLRRPQQRYAAGVMALAVMAGCLPITYRLVEPPPRFLIATAVDQDVGAPVTVAGIAIAVTGAGGAYDSSHESPAIPVAIEPAKMPAAAMKLDRDTTWRAELYRRIVVAWLAGVVVFSLRLLSGAIGLRLLTGRTKPVSGAYADLLEQLGRKMRFGRLPRLVISRRVTEAIAAGFFRPVIVLPAAWLAELPPSVIEAVLAHELAHIRRYDLWVNLLQRTVEAVLFFHPAVWWVSRQVRSDREMCCDELAVAATGQKVAYVSALEVVARRAAREPLFSLATGIGGRKMQLLERVRHVLGLPARQRAGGWWAAAVFALAVPCGLWALTGPATTRALAQDEEREGDRDGREDERDEREGDRDEREGDREEEEGDRPEREGDRGEREGDRPERDREARGDRERDRGGPSPEARAAREARGERREAERRREREVRERGDRPRVERDLEVELEFRGDRSERMLERRAQAEDQRRRAEQRAHEARARQQKVRADIERAHAEIQRRMAEAQRQISEEMRQAAERGEQEKVEAMRRELEAMRANAEEQVRATEEKMRVVNRELEQRSDLQRSLGERLDLELRPRRGPPDGRPGMEAQREMLQMIRELRNEVQQLRREVRALRDGEGQKDRPRGERRKESAKVPILGDVPYVGRLFRNEEIEVELQRDDLKATQDATIEFSKDPVKFDGVTLELDTGPVTIDGGKLEIKNPPVKLDDVGIELSKEPVKLDGVKVELKDRPVKLNDVTIEFTKDPVKLDGVKVESAKEPVKIDGVKLELKSDPAEQQKAAEIEFKKSLKAAEIEFTKPAAIELKELKTELKELKKADLDLNSSLDDLIQQNVEVRYASKAKDLAKAELEKALEANWATPDAVSAKELEKLKQTHNRGVLKLEQVKREALDRLSKPKKGQGNQSEDLSEKKDKSAEPAKQ